MRSRISMAGWIAVTAAVAVLATARPAHAQETVTASVPFDFQVDGTAMPAGDYTISTEADSMVVSLRSRDGHAMKFVLTTPAAEADPRQPPELVFLHDGDQYRLDRIVMVDEFVRAFPLPSEIRARGADRVAVLLQPLTSGSR